MQQFKIIFIKMDRCPCIQYCKTIGYPTDGIYESTYVQLNTYVFICLNIYLCISI